MSSTTKIISVCLCCIITYFIIVTEAGHHSSALEPLLACGVLSLLLKDKHKYTGRAQSYHQPRPAFQSFEPAGIQGGREVQGNDDHEYQDQQRINGGRYEIGRYQYADDAADEMFTQPRYVQSTYNRPGYAMN